MIKVITYGTYDLLHYGHIRLLERAKALGDYLDRLGGAFALVFAMTASCAVVLLAALRVAAAMTAG